ncbi:MAG: DUF4974 domain-containing protein [Chitinophagaceae bacterium]|nr:DUF4974 domain-containing protein [Chitinophagaceae bacterium]
MINQHIAELLNRFFQGTISPEEKESLADWINESDEEDLKMLMEQSWERYDPDQTLGIDKSGALLRSILSKAKEEESISPKVIHLRYRRWLRIAAAAVIIGLIGSGVYMFFNTSYKKPADVAIIKPASRDIAPPDAVNAVLTLASGQQIVLDSIQNGQLASQGNTNILKLSNDRIAYHDVTSGNKKPEYNTLTVPRGSRTINLVLADGTSVLLNAASSITYPTVFAGNERRVEMSGEAYFEVAKDPVKKFIVGVNGVNTEVLGTHFNINAYSDMGSIDITLLEGRIKVANDETTLTLSPGEQAQLNRKGKIDLNKDVDTDQVMAWKDGLFNFSNLSLENIMLQLSRWYNIDVLYEGEKSGKHFSGIMSRNSSLSEVLKIMQRAGLQFIIEENKVIVKQ